MAIILLVGFPVHASFISVPILFARNVLAAIRGETKEIVPEED
jgi:hypothetical protein